ncbi:MAG: SPASM domain-containing protein [Nitrospirae bacterium]|nr:SPASM domain-containing protein [Nitrospirota bacterium]
MQNNKSKSSEELSRFVVTIEDKIEDYGCTYLCSTRYGTIIQVENGLELFKDEDKEILRQEGFLVKDTEQEKSEVLDYPSQFYKEAVLQVIITRNCNFACPHCIQNDIKTSGTMTEEVIDGITRFTREYMLNNKEDQQVESLKVVIFGGEPLVAFHVIDSLTRKIKSISDNLKVAFSITTNGSLMTPEISESLRDLGVTGAVITIDGIKENHNKSRPRKSGKSSFEDIIYNICYALDNNILKIGINCLYTQENYKSAFIPLLDLFCSLSIADKLSLVRFAPVLDTGCGVGCASSGMSWIAEALPFLRQNKLQRNIKAKPFIYPFLCAVEHKNFFTIDVDGSLYKCPGMVGVEQYKIGDVFTGVKDFSEIYNLDLLQNTPKCRDECKYLPLCRGGCRYVSYLQHKNMDKVDCRLPFFQKAFGTLIKQDIEYDVQ